MGLTKNLLRESSTGMGPTGTTAPTAPWFSPKPWPSGTILPCQQHPNKRDAAGKFTVDKSDIAQIQSDFARQSHQLPVSLTNCPWSSPGRCRLTTAETPRCHPCPSRSLCPPSRPSASRPLEATSAPATPADLSTRLPHHSPAPSPPPPSPAPTLSLST